MFYANTHFVWAMLHILASQTTSVRYEGMVFVVWSALLSAKGESNENINSIRNNNIDSNSTTGTTLT